MIDQAEPGAMMHLMPLKTLLIGPLNAHGPSTP
jgi:hypothetical protein